jgi:phospholipid-translocating ATPase
MLKSGGSHLLKVPEKLHLKGGADKNNRNDDDIENVYLNEESNVLSPATSRGSEFASITSEETPDKVDKSVKIQLDYKAESPDEAALVSAAKNAGFTFVKRKGNKLTVDILGNEYTFKLLNTLEFNSDRKRMSVILERPEPWNDIVVYCKGADNVISERLESNGQDSILETTEQHIGLFSNNGLRTLMLAYRILDKQEYENWKVEMNEASTSTQDRAEKVASVQEKIETNLKLIGATAIEDKLQEGVPKCIEHLRQAGIKVWVLTGDKLETAINIGYASSLLDGEMTLWKIKGGKDHDVSKNLDDVIENLDEIERQSENGDAPTFKENALVIEGSALTAIFEETELKEKLLSIADRCKSVVCCRVSPLQKALVVELVRKYHDVVTLAVGDGANDVSMIQVANVGVGIAGQEGVQAAMAADYSIAQFRFLEKLLIVQGHWCYARIAEMILTFFFKNIFWVFPALWYQIYSAWSGNIFYDYSFLQLYNIIFTVAPVVIIGRL